jgi:hypothetical protein
LTQCYNWQRCQHGCHSCVWGQHDCAHLWFL